MHKSHLLKSCASSPLGMQRCGMEAPLPHRHPNWPMTSTSPPLRTVPTFCQPQDRGNSVATRSGYGRTQWPSPQLLGRKVASKPLGQKPADAGEASQRRKERPSTTSTPGPPSRRRLRRTKPLQNTPALPRGKVEPSTRSQGQAPGGTTGQTAPAPGPPSHAQQRIAAVLARVRAREQAGT